MPMDCRGVRRGRCSLCACSEYNGGSEGKRCLDCSHVPGKHENMDVITIVTSVPQEPLEQRVSPVPVLAESTAGSTESADTDQESIESPLAGNFDCELNTTSPVSSEQCIYPDCEHLRHGKHEFCGRTHAQMYHNASQRLEVTPEKVCSTPSCTRPRYNKGNGTTFDYCSINCRDNKQRTGQAVRLQEEELGTCLIPDCTEFKYQDPANGRVHNFCSRSHAEQAKLDGISNPESNSSISLVNLMAEEGAKVSKMFKQMWDERKGTCPSISFLFSITNAFLRQTWYAYKETLGDRSKEFYFHGTLLKCNITTQLSLCTNEDCGVCGIGTTGFDRRCIRKNINFQRFGHGFYVAPNSSKCHDYTQGKHGFRAMILMEVLPGRKYVRKTDDETLKQPPSGFDSVHGKSGNSLNYDELVLYNPDGAFPKYIIVYQHKGEDRIAK